MAQRFRPVIEIDGLAPLTHCLRLSISQAIFDHHHFELVVPYKTLEGPKGNGFFKTAPEKLCGKSITIKFAPVVAGQPTPAFEFKGLITQLRLGNTDDLASVYIIEGYSPTYLLEDSTQRRTFVEQTLKNICDKVLTGYDKNVLISKVDVRHKTKEIPYAVQYDENTFTFLKRMAAVHGQWLYYTGTQLLIGLADESKATDFIVGGAQSFSLTISLRPTKLKASEYNYLENQDLVTASEGPTQTDLSKFAKAKSEKLFRYTSHVGVGQPLLEEGELKKALNQLEANLTGSLVVFEGVGENPDVVVGKRIKVKKPGEDSTAAMADLGEYRVLAIEHWLDNEGNYFNKFRAIPYEKKGDVPVPWVAPVAGALELAEVINVNDPKNLGRIKVQYMWPIAKTNPDAARSGWLRVSTPYSGDGKGQLFTPEVGSQVLVGYEQQQAERPVVLGNLFHRNKKVATYTHDNNKIKGLQTAGGNKLVLDDTKGKQTVLISNSNKKGTAVKLSFAGDGSITIESEGPVTVKSPTIALEAGKEGSISLHGKMITIEADEMLTLKSDHKTQVRAKTLDAEATNVMVHGVATTAIRGGIVDIN